VCVCVYTRVHTHTLLDCIREDHLNVQSTFVYIYAGLRDADLRVVNVQRRASLGRVQQNYLDFQKHSLGQGQFKYKGTMDLALEGEDEGDLVSVGKWDLTRAYKVNFAGQPGTELAKRFV